ncbi:MAG: hypothetical protein ACRDOK_00410 [Streptosporangiaceae bacterium]
MTHFVLAFSHPQGPASTPGTGTYWVAFGILVGMATVWFTPGLVKSLVLVFDLVALGWSAVILHYADTGTGRWVLIAAAFLLIGMFIGVLNGLRHLGEAEYQGRKTSVRRIGGWL